MLWGLGAWRCVRQGYGHVAWCSDACLCAYSHPNVRSFWRERGCTTHSEGLSCLDRLAAVLSCIDGKCFMVYAGAATSGGRWPLGGGFEGRVVCDGCAHARRRWRLLAVQNHSRHAAAAVVCLQRPGSCTVW